MTNVAEVIKQINQEKTRAGRQRRPKLVLPILLGAAVILISVFYLTIFITSRVSWRAVFLTNNQVYFGRLFWHPLGTSAVLTDIYYLQADKKLVKFGSELHNPRDKMVIPKSQILFWEDLRRDSLIVKKIEQGNKK